MLTSALKIKICINDIDSHPYPLPLRHPPPFVFNCYSFIIISTHRWHCLRVEQHTPNRTLFFPGKSLEETQTSTRRGWRGIKVPPTINFNEHDRVGGVSEIETFCVWCFATAIDRQAINIHQSAPYSMRLIPDEAFFQLFSSTMVLMMIGHTREAKKGSRLIIQSNFSISIFLHFLTNRLRCGEKIRPLLAGEQRQSDSWMALKR